MNEAIELQRQIKQLNKKIEGLASVGAVITNSSAPTVAITAAGAGANATTSVVGRDCAGTITLNTSNADTPLANSTILTLTFNALHAAAPVVLIMPANDAAWALAYSIVRCRQADVSVTVFTLRSGSTPLPAMTTATYIWNYIAI